MERIFEKQFLLTGFLEYLIKMYFSKTDSSQSDENKSDLTVEIVTPDNTKERGSQLSLLFSQDLKAVHEKVEKMGVVVSTNAKNDLNQVKKPINKIYGLYINILRFVIFQQCDMRSDIIRVAPAPLYNSFMDVWRFVEIVNNLTRKKN